METFDDFWRMMWEQMSSIIVMLTKLEERGRVSLQYGVALQFLFVTHLVRCCRSVSRALKERVVLYASLFHCVTPVCFSVSLCHAILSFRLFFSGSVISTGPSVVQGVMVRSR